MGKNFEPVQIDTDEWLYKGCFIQKSVHPKLFGNFEVFKNDEKQTHVGRVCEFKQAKDLCDKNECNEHYLKF